MQGAGGYCPEDPRIILEIGGCPLAWANCCVTTPPHPPSLPSSRWTWASSKRWKHTLAHIWPRCHTPVTQSLQAHMLGLQGDEELAGLCPEWCLALGKCLAIIYWMN